MVSDNKKQEDQPNLTPTGVRSGPAMIQKLGEQTRTRKEAKQISEVPGSQLRPSLSRMKLAHSRKSINEKVN